MHELERPQKVSTAVRPKVARIITMDDVWGDDDEDQGENYDDVTSS